VLADRSIKAAHEKCPTKFIFFRKMLNIAKTARKFDIDLGWGLVQDASV
jgi:hypothetical protein